MVRLTFFLFVIALSVSLRCNAQTRAAVSQEDSEEFFAQFKSMLLNIENTKFLSIYDDSFRGTVITLRPKRTPVIRNEDYASLAKDLERVKNPNNQYNYKNIELQNIVINEPYAIISFTHEFFFTKGEELKFEGVNNASVVIKKFNDQKIRIIAQTTVSNIPSEYIGNCYCRFKKENNNYVINVEYPYGNEYEYTSEEIYKIPSEKNLFIYYGKAYRWDGLEKVFRYNPNTDSDIEEIAKASSLDMAMAKVIQQVTFKNICLSMRIYSK